MAAAAEALAPNGGAFLRASTMTVSGSGLYKAVQLESDGALVDPSDDEAGRIEAGFLGQDLFSVNENYLMPPPGGDEVVPCTEEGERRALRERMQAYDMYRVESQSNLTLGTSSNCVPAHARNASLSLSLPLVVTYERSRSRRVTQLRSWAQVTNSHSTPTGTGG